MHWISCGDSGGGTPWVNGLRMATGAGYVNLMECILGVGTCSQNKLLDLFNGVYSTASFHPNKTGQHEMGRLFNEQARGVRPSLSILQPDTSTLYRNTPGEVFLKGVGGTGAYRWSISAGAPPPGMKIDRNTGVIGGWPSKAGSFSFTVSLVAGQSNATRRLVLTVLQTRYDHNPAVSRFRGGKFASVYDLTDITIGPDGALWYTDFEGAVIASRPAARSLRTLIPAWFSPTALQLGPTAHFGHKRQLVRRANHD